MPPFTKAQSKKQGGPPPPKSGATDAGDAPITRGMLADETEFINNLMYGNPGSGKTTQLAHLSKLGPIVFINAEAGIKKTALRQFPDVKLDQIEVFPAKGQSISYESLDNLFWEIKAKLDGDPNAYAGVIWDSVTEIHKILLEAVTRKEVDKAIRKAERAGMEPEIDEWFIDRSYYGVMTEQMRALIRKYRDLPCHVGFSALPRRDLNEKTGDISYGPALTPALQTDLAGYVDVLCHCEVDDEGLYIGRFRQQGIKMAKDRFHMIPPVLVSPTYDRIIGYVNGEITEENDDLQDPIKERRARRASRKTEEKEKEES